MTTNLQGYTLGGFSTGRNWLVRILWYYTNSFIFKSYWFPFSGLKVLLLRIFGAKVGVGVNIKPNVNIKYPWRLSIGEFTWIGEEVWIDNLASVSIGANCCLSQGAFLLCGNHNYKKTTFDLITQPITLEDGVWIGAKAIVCPGVIIASHAVLSVMSVATNNLESFKIYQGNPAKEIKIRNIKST